ncbi:MAG: hypothetical protein U9R08_00335 [Nanoarchaeota archaeon]|nr:hypothetical protein [Nanoarchaeota archaeon]
MKYKSRMKTEGYQGATFGVMEGVIMMLGVLIGLSMTGNKSIAILGVVTAGVADALANSSAFYVSEESEGIHTKKEVWKSTWWAFAGTVIAVVCVLIPLLVFDLPNAIYAAFIVAVVLLIFLAMFVAKNLKLNLKKLVIKYVVMAVVVAIATFVVSNLLLRVLVI